jgi:Uma2 family endonuclease
MSGTSIMNTATDQWPQRHLITVEEYQRMAETGVLAPDARVELIEGEIFDMAPIGTGHAYVVNELTRLLAEVVRGKAMLAVQQAIRLGPRSQPQPDLSLAKLPAIQYRRSHPQPADLLLVVEVSDSTLAHDRNVKLPLYARHGIPEVWLIDLNSWQLHCWREPQADRYVSATVLTRGSVEVFALPGATIDLSSVLIGD